MYPSDLSVSTVAAAASAAIFLFATTLIAADDARADMLIERASQQHRAPLELPPIKANAEPGDDTAALEAIEIALTQAGDGATYVWRRGNGRLVGAVRPTSTFRDADRRICRHIEMQMRLGTYTRRTEGIACRGADGVWLLEG